MGGWLDVDGGWAEAHFSWPFCRMPGPFGHVPHVDLIAYFKDNTTLSQVENETGCDDVELSRSRLRNNA